MSTWKSTSSGIEFIVSQLFDQAGSGDSHRRDGSVHLRLAEKIREALAEPYRQFREIGDRQRVVILVIHRRKGIRALRIEIHRRVVLIQPVANTPEGCAWPFVQ